MKASELIEVLKKAVEEHGDLPIFADNEYDECGEFEVKLLEYRPEKKYLIPSMLDPERLVFVSD